MYLPPTVVLELNSVRTKTDISVLVSSALSLPLPFHHIYYSLKNKMPIPIITTAITEGTNSIPHLWTVLKILPWAVLLAALKYYFGGARNTSERLMHSKVVMITVLTTHNSPSPRKPQY